jgi:alpha-glucosidase
LIDDYEARLPPGGWPNWVLGNHDRPRIASRVGPEQARIAAMLLLTSRGTPTIYYGDEIGMDEVMVPRNRVRDPLGMNIPVGALGRDGCRTPMQWEANDHAGFSEVEPWLPVSDDFLTRNVATQRADSGSIYNLHRGLIHLRRTRPALVVGAYKPLKASGDLLLFVRHLEADQLLIALNFGSEPISVSFTSGSLVGRLLLSSAGDRQAEKVSQAVDLRPNEGVVIELLDQWAECRRI